MTYLKLFWAFFEIGAFSFGGGYGMLSFVREKVLYYNWLNENEFLNLVAISEATPGPVAINMATFVGSEQAGVIGALCATLGAVIPSFVLVLLIAGFVKNLLKYNGVASFLDGVRPSVVGLITATAITMLMSNLLGVQSPISDLAPDFVAIAVFVVLIVISFMYKRLRGKSLSPVTLLIFSAGIGIAEGILKNGIAP